VRPTSEAPIAQDEVIELAKEVQRELAKPTLNGTRIHSLISGISQTISYVPKLKAAYDTIKWAAAMINVTLP
jgi:hypothetical protein